MASETIMNWPWPVKFMRVNSWLHPRLRLFLRRGTLAWQVAENICQLRSQLIEILNVPQGYASGFDSPAALLNRLFEQPA